MSSASWALQTAIHTALSSDAAVLEALGGARIYDDVPRGVVYPYVTFGPSSVRDWSTGTEAGDEHAVTLHVWSRSAGRREAEKIMTAIRAALHDRPLALAGHLLANLRCESSEARRDPDGETYQGSVRLRAVTEPPSQ